MMSDCTPVWNGPNAGPEGERDKGYESHYTDEVWAFDFIFFEYDLSYHKVECVLDDMVYDILHIDCIYLYKKNAYL